MKYDFKIEHDKNQLLVTVDIPPRLKIKNPRVVVRSIEIEKTIKQTFDPPKGYVLGECVSSTTQRLDNYDPRRLSGVWTFKLVSNQKTKVVSKTPSSSRRSRKKTTKTD
jgi:hypothetical protein